MPSSAPARQPVRQNGADQSRPANGNSNGGNRQIQPVSAIDAPLAAAVNMGWDKIGPALGALVTPEKIITVLGISAYKNPKLRECVPMTIVNAIVQSGTLGLDLHPTKGEAWLIPRWNKDIPNGNGGKGGLECCFQPGYRGIIKLWKASGEVASAQCRLVYHGEPFDVQYGSDSPGDSDLIWHHKPDFDAPGDPNAVRYAYCYVKLRSGEPLIEVMNRHQIEASRARGKATGFSPWVTDWEAMARRCPVVPMGKWITMDDKVARAFELMREDVIETTATISTPSSPALGSAGLKKMLERSPMKGADPQGGGANEPPEEAEEPQQETPAVTFEAWVDVRIAQGQEWWLSVAKERGLTLDDGHKVIVDFDSFINEAATDAVTRGILDEQFTLIESPHEPGKMVRGRQRTIDCVRWLYEEHAAELAEIVEAHLVAKAERWTKELVAPAKATPAQPPVETKASVVTPASEAKAAREAEATRLRSNMTAPAKQAVREPQKGGRQAETLLPDDDDKMASNPADA